MACKSKSRLTTERSQQVFLLLVASSCTFTLWLYITHPMPDPFVPFG